LNTVKHPLSANDVALQPCIANGVIFVSNCVDGILRLFDIRQSVTGV